MSVSRRLVDELRHIHVMEYQLRKRIRKLIRTDVKIIQDVLLKNKTSCRNTYIRVWICFYMRRDSEKDTQQSAEGCAGYLRDVVERDGQWTVVRRYFSSHSFLQFLSFETYNIYLFNFYLFKNLNNQI